MSYKALYRSYRPQTFGEVAGQEHIVTTLKNAIKENRISHAYLLLLGNILMLLKLMLRAIMGLMKFET